MRPVERDVKMDCYFQVRGTKEDLVNIAKAARAASRSRSAFIRDLLIANNVIDA